MGNHYDAPTNDGWNASNSRTGEKHYGPSPQIDPARPCARTGDASGSQARACPRRRQIKIGFLLKTMQEERYQRDKAAFVAKAKALGAACSTTG
jgi:hypothetical protein